LLLQVAVVVLLKVAVVRVVIEQHQVFQYLLAPLSLSQ
jgi:hypothetical protein